MRKDSVDRETEDRFERRLPGRPSWPGRFREQLSRSASVPSAEPQPSRVDPSERGDRDEALDARRRLRPTIEELAACSPRQHRVAQVLDLVHLCGITSVARVARILSLDVAEARRLLEEGENALAEAQRQSEG